jgi:putative phosphonate metabolism protein
MRYAIYYAPERDDPLWAAGCLWLGRDPESGDMFAPPREAAGLIDHPARYGLHATLKPPFALADDTDEAALDRALAAFAAGRASEPMPALAIRPLHGFLAIRPAGDADALHRLADSCVEVFDAFRRPASSSELAMRRAGGLTPAQDAHLARWGYPYVFDEYRFHMTLTARLDEPARDRLEDILVARFATSLAAPRRLSSLALFVEPEAGKNFSLRRRYPFADR